MKDKLKKIATLPVIGLILIALSVFIHLLGGSSVSAEPTSGESDFSKRKGYTYERCMGKTGDFRYICNHLVEKVVNKEMPLQIFVETISGEFHPEYIHWKEVIAEEKVKEAHIEH